MRPVPFRHVGGAVIADHGALTLDATRHLAEFYCAEAERAADQGDTAWVWTCARRALALAKAGIAAAAWRRAGGWRDPFRADRPPRHS